jgi:hypothetical protein
MSCSYFHRARRPADSGQNENAIETGVRSNFNAGEWMIGFKPSPPLPLPVGSNAEPIAHAGKKIKGGNRRQHFLSQMAVATSGSFVV